MQETCWWCGETMHGEGPCYHADALELAIAKGLGMIEMTGKPPQFWRDQRVNVWRVQLIAADIKSAFKRWLGE